MIQFLGFFFLWTYASCSWVSRDQGWAVGIISENISCLFSLCCVKSFSSDLHCRCRKEAAGVIQRWAGCKGTLFSQNQRCKNSETCVPSKGRFGSKIRLIRERDRPSCLFIQPLQNGYCMEAESLWKNGRRGTSARKASFRGQKSIGLKWQLTTFKLNYILHRKFKGTVEVFFSNRNRRKLRKQGECYPGRVSWRQKAM